MPKRTDWTKINLDDARDSIQMMDDAEVGRWFRGWVAGASGKSFPEKLAAWPVEMRSGFAAGVLSFEDSQAYSAKQRARVASRYQNPTGSLPDSTAVTFGSENSTGSLPANSQQPTANNEQPAASNQGQASRIPSSEWTPDSSHAGICDVRNLSMELQLERFRATAGTAAGSMDTPEGWSRRFMAWIAKGHPEPVFSPAAAMPGTSAPAPEWVIAKVDGYRDEIRRHMAEIERLEAKQKTTTLTQQAVDKLRTAKAAVEELREKIKKLGVQP